MSRHKWADVIHAWADGAEIQSKDNDRWMDTIFPTWHPNNEYRIKPKTVKREGWVNINSHQSIFATKEDAEAQSFAGCIATVKVEWEEEQ